MNDTDSDGKKCCNKAPKILAAVIALILMATAGAFCIRDKADKRAAPAQDAAVTEQAADAAATGEDTAAEKAADSAVAETVKTDEAATTDDAAKTDDAAATPATTDEATAAATDAVTDAAVKEGDPVVAVVNGNDIKRSAVLDFISTLPDHIRQMPVDNLFPLALEQVVTNEVINKKAAAANIEHDPEVEKLMNQAKDQIIRSVYVERQVEEKISPKELEDAYKQMVEKMGKVEETHARHILVDTEEKAREIIGKLDAGEKFEDLAKQYTSDPSGQNNGGDLGYFTKTDMVPEFADAAFALEPGKYTKDPVKTQFGWHVIKVEDRRTRPAPTMDQVKPQLEQQLRQKTLADLVAGWEKDADVKKFDINGGPAKETDTVKPE